MSRRLSRTLDAITCVATLAVIVLIGWWVWDVGAGPSRLLVGASDHYVGEAWELAIDRAVPSLGRSGAGTSLPAEAAIDALMKLLIGARASDPDGLLMAAVPALGIDGPPIIYEPPFPSVPVVVAPKPSDEPSEPSQEEPEPSQPSTPTSGPIVFVYHSHAREAYLPSEINSGEIKFADAHTDDLSKTVVAVGEHLANELTRLGLPTLHSSYVHDRDGRLGAYAEAAETLAEVSRAHPSLVIYLDVHRDAQRRKLTTGKIDGQDAARIMLVLGMTNPGWQQNYEFGARILERMEARAPGIPRGIRPKDSRYNQHISPAALLLELGGPENSVEEAKRTVKLFAEVLAEMYQAGDLPPYAEEVLARREPP